MAYGAKCGWHGNRYEFSRRGRLLPVSLAGCPEPVRHQKNTGPSGDQPAKNMLKLTLETLFIVLSQPGVLGVLMGTAIIGALVWVAVATLLDNAN